MSEYRKEAQCPFCMSTEYFKYEPGKNGIEYAWRADKGPGITVALKHKTTCPRYLKCMGCGGPAITGWYGLCWTCCEKDEASHREITINADFNAVDEAGLVRLSTEGAKKSLEGTDVKAGDLVWLSDGEIRIVGCLEERDGAFVARLSPETREDLLESGEAEGGYREIDVDALNTIVRITPRDGGEPVEANGATVVRFLSDKMDERGIYKLVSFIGRGEVRLAFSTTSVPLDDGWYTVERVGPEDFVPDFHRCNACGNVGADAFGYDPNPKGLPPVEAPALAVVIEDAEGERLRLRGAGKMAGFTETAEQRARWAGTGPRRVTGFPVLDEMVGKGFEPGKLAVLTPAPIPIADIFGCARTGEEGVVFCRKCNSYDIGHVSGADRNKLMLERCERDLKPDFGGFTPVLKGEEDFIAALRLKGDVGGFDFGLMDTLRLYKNYKKLEAD